MLELAFAPTAAVALVAGPAVALRLFAPGRVPGRREAIVWSAGWLILALAVAVGIALAGGPAGEWTTVYLIERSLSLDNVFLFSLLLAYFLVPPELRGRVVLIGVAGTLLLRGIAIAGGVALVESVEAIVYLFGALLLFGARGNSGLRDLPRDGRSRTRQRRQRYLPSRRLAEETEWVTPALRAHRAIAAARPGRGRRGMRLRASARPRRTRHSTGRR